MEFFALCIAGTVRCLVLIYGLNYLWRHFYGVGTRSNAQRAIRTLLDGDALALAGFVSFAGLLLKTNHLTKILLKTNTPLRICLLFTRLDD